MHRLVCGPGTLQLNYPAGVDRGFRPNSARASEFLLPTLPQLGPLPHGAAEPWAALVAPGQQPVSSAAAAAQGRETPRPRRRACAVQFIVFAKLIGGRQQMVLRPTDQLKITTAYITTLPNEAHIHILACIVAYVNTRTIIDNREAGSVTYNTGVCMCVRT